MSSKLLDLTGEELMNEISKGKGMTGSGAVVVLSAIAAAELLCSICKLTLAKEKYEHVHADMQDILHKLEDDRLPILRKILDADADAVFALVISRIKRNQEKDSKQKTVLIREAFDRLEDATNTMMDFCDVALETVPLAIHICKVGQKSARADAAVAINTLVSSISSALFMVLTNLKAAENTAWVDGKHSEVETCFGRLHEYQSIFNGKLAHLYNNTWE